MTGMRLIARMIRRRLEKLPLSADILDEYKESLRCPKCGAEMESIGSGVGCVVPPILVLKCPQCGYEERSWACPGY